MSDFSEFDAENGLNNVSVGTQHDPNQDPLVLDGADASVFSGTNGFISKHWDELGKHLSAPSAKENLLKHMQETHETISTAMNSPRSNPDNGESINSARSPPTSPIIATIKAAYTSRTGIAVESPPSSSEAINKTSRNPSRKGESNSQFSKQEYWDGRFEEEEKYDWLLSFSQVAPMLLPLLEPFTSNAYILIVGCGNSTFSADLYDAGYHNIVNIDYSGVVINRMRAEHTLSRPGMTWLEMDMTKLEFPQGTVFDIVIDKAALDALMVDEKSVWSPAEEVIRAADATCLGVRRYLRSATAVAEEIPPASHPTSNSAPSLEALAAAATAATVHIGRCSPIAGLYVMISFMQPHFRTKYLSGSHADGLEDLRQEQHTAVGHATPAVGYAPRYDWTLSVKAIELDAGSFNHFMYVMYSGLHS